MPDVRLVKQKEYKDELLTLFRVSMGHSISSELWDWKYFLNPMISNDPEIIVAMDKGNIVGTRPFLLAKFWLNGKKVKVAQPCDTVVHPEYRRQGLFSIMNNFAIDYFKQNDYALFYNFPGEMSRPGYLKQGWNIVLPLDTYFLITNPQKVISHKLKNTILVAIGGIFYEKLLNPRTKKIIPTNFKIEAFSNFKHQLKSTDALSHKHGIALVRDEAYLRWRFDQHPKNKYIYIIAEKDNELWGYAVVSAQNSIDGLTHGIIVDYLVKNDDKECFQILIYSCLEILASYQPDLISIIMPTQPFYKRTLSKHFGFHSFSMPPYSIFLNKGFLVARDINQQIIGDVDIYNKYNWQVTHAYMDTM